MSSEKKLVDQLQDDYFYYGDDSDETIIDVVLDYMSNNKEYLKNEYIMNKIKQVFRDEYIHDKKLDESKDFYYKLKQRDYEFDIESAIVVNQLKPQFEVDVKDETLRRLKRKNLDIKNEELFNHIQEEVHDTISNYSSVLSLYNGDVNKYEKSEEYKYLVNKETLQQYR
ncbi:3313_t:CDS:1, partial [Cetraspora pellucida]